MLDIFEAAALSAGRAILEIRDAGPTTHYKADCSPVTEADERAERIILDALTKHYPHIPAIAEEAVARGDIPSVENGSFFLIDPLDGTKEFVGGRDDFTVNIALIEAGRPAVGFVYAPALGLAYGGADGVACKLLIAEDFTVVSRTAIRASTMRQPPIAVASRSHRTTETDAFLVRSQASEIRSIGSSLKFCLLAEGEADIYPRFSRTMEWDTAAGDAVLRAAGGETSGKDGSPLQYGKLGCSQDTRFENPDFIAYGARPRPSSAD
ncbi:3'(2'),5'-bisphosphate nucleotidase [Rhizobium deserti]|uniref:3'(2'),5'-bisphosphate nucleotidase CysQ n=1 Tax=Rhizobium deserti TaxID=2547961 RepID=A0A4R5ULB8_9HYPH|nr:3'(2'),5'-bisphosphate nucleotidase CysQ [Rhizobium deserti]TDK37609.1 3'(2'),5'-bisphosphate nucleotidase [Rhizobium deserti]